MSAYGWKITWANLNVFDDDEYFPVGTIGPGDIDPDILETLQNDLDENHPHVHKFDMYDDDGILYFSGVLIGEDAEGCEPLYDYGEPYAGCTQIVCKFNGKQEVFN